MFADHTLVCLSILRQVPGKWCTKRERWKTPWRILWRVRKLNFERPIHFDSAHPVKFMTNVRRLGCIDCTDLGTASECFTLARCRGEWRLESFSPAFCKRRSSVSRQSWALCDESWNIPFDACVCLCNLPLYSRGCAHSFSQKRVCVNGVWSKANKRSLCGSVLSYQCRTKYMKRDLFAQCAFNLANDLSGLSYAANKNNNKQRKWAQHFTNTLQSQHQ